VFERVLIANRGEIACRVARTCRALGIQSVAVYSDADAAAPHVVLADSAIRLGPAPVRDSYLSLDALIAAVSSSGADAVHPGYGFFSENAGFARAVARAGAVFIGPSPEAIERLGDKIGARALARGVGVEPPPGSAAGIPADDIAELERVALAVGYPVIVKAAAGGGGIGMLVAANAAELPRAAKSAAERARQAFGDARIYLERYLERPRHIEVQVLADSHGSVVALGERECSVQRRHQKIIEETPSPLFSGSGGSERRAALEQAALSIVRAADYQGAGTVEFIAAAGGSNAFFLEVNARIQVEHPVTEMVSGLDLVEAQLRIAAGEPLSEAVLRAPRNGAAIEARLYAEDPARGFVPQPGRIEHLKFPEPAADLRIESGVVEGYEITPHYDPLLAKLVAWAPTRERAIARLAEALAQTEVRVLGPKAPRATNLQLLRALLEHPDFVAGTYDTGLVERARQPA
jgi:acetyl-CoA carboxylase biotin carboxylase subunit/3-methylcrotonyl-CoA carboxylase alpha subunit